MLKGSASLPFTTRKRNPLWLAFRPLWLTSSWCGKELLFLLTNSYQTDASCPGFSLIWPSARKEKLGFGRDLWKSLNWLERDYIAKTIEPCLESLLCNIISLPCVHFLSISHKIVATGLLGRADRDIFEFQKMLARSHRGHELSSWADHPKSRVWEVILVLFFKVGFPSVLTVADVEMFHELFRANRGMQRFGKDLYSLKMSLWNILFTIWREKRSIPGQCDTTQD